MSSPPRRDRRRLVKRWLRSLVGLDVFQRRQCRVPTLQLGSSAARWSVAPAGLTAASVVYVFGIGRDITFERELIARFGVTVHAFDPTPLALEWLATQTLPPEFVTHEIGIADYDGTARFAPPSKATWESFSMVRTKGIGEAVEAPVRRLAALLTMLGHTHIDLLKMDIEGTEYAVLPDLLASGIRPSQLLIEFHHRWREVGARPTREAIALLNRHGYLVADASPKGTEYTFVSGSAAPGRMDP